MYTHMCVCTDVRIMNIHHMITYTYACAYASVAAAAAAAAPPPLPPLLCHCSPQQTACVRKGHAEGQLASEWNTMFKH